MPEIGASAVMDRKEAIPVAANFTLAACHAFVNIYQFFILPLWLLPRDLLWAWTLAPLMLLNNPYWSLIHEAIHDLFHPQKRINIFFGRALSVLFGSPFQILRLSHLLHHKLNRTPVEATEIYERGKGSFFMAACGYYFQILGGLYLVEILSPFLFYLPSGWLEKFRSRFIKAETVSGILMQNWSRKEVTREIRIDGLLIFVWFGAATIWYGVHWPLLIGALAARAFLISFLDNVYHYETPLNDIFYAANLRLPRTASRLLLNFNLHGIHHQNPAIPWRSLPGIFTETAKIFQGNYLTAAARQLRGPVAVQDLPQSR